MSATAPLTVLVTDGNERPALAVVRALGRRGMTVLVGADRPTSLASASNCCARHVTYPSPALDREAFERFLIDFLARERIDVLLPTTDLTMRSVCANEAAIRRHTAVAIPSFEAFDLVSDKARLAAHAARCGVRVPRTLVVDGAAALAKVIGQAKYPAVVKPACSRIPGARGSRAAGVHYAASEAELRELYRNAPDLASHPSLIQERIAGPGLGVFVLFDRGRLTAIFGHRRLRERPPSGGVSVLRESVAVPPRLRHDAICLLGSIGWHGVAMLEYKQDVRTGRLHLIEVNGRFWGSLQLAIDAGLDFPHLVCELAHGRSADAPPYRIGVKSRWLLGDLDHLLLRLFRSRRELCLPPSAPPRWRTVLDFMKIAGRDLHYEVISRDDPAPFLYELARYGGAVAGSAARSLRRQATRLARLSGGTPAVRPTFQP